MPRSGQPSRTSIEFRRSPHLLLHWRGERLELHNYATDVAIRASAFLIEVLERFGDWQNVDRYLASQPTSMRPTLRQLVLTLHRQKFLRRRDEELTVGERHLDAWNGWNPAAGFFHARTRHNTIGDLDTAIASVQKQARTRSAPSALKQYPEATRISLPPPDTTGSFPDVLRARRTWRRFGPDAVPLASLSTLLNLSAGVQQWVTARGEGRVPLKTSPSGGARHPIEVYVAARNIATLDPGIYHYTAGDHALERLPSTGRRPAFDTFLPTQWWYRDAAAVVFFTGVFERTRWRYQSPRAYRAVLIEAGHVCQTFCLTATWLGLAPFCSMALDDAAIERALGLDGMSEAVIYAAGVGAQAATSHALPPGALPTRAIAASRRKGR